MVKKPNKCVQCGKDMLNQYGNSDWSAPFCENPECPNYGLLQTGIFNKKECPHRIPDCPKDNHKGELEQLRIRVSYLESYISGSESKI